MFEDSLIILGKYYCRMKYRTLSLLVWRSRPNAFEEWLNNYVHQL
jgi:hypothetical protein